MKKLLETTMKWLLIMIAAVGVFIAAAMETGFLHKPEGFDPVGWISSLFTDSSIDLSGVPDNARGFAVHVIDVGQGDSILICTEEMNILIDGAEKDASDEIIAFIESLKIKHLDMVIATHPHSDHIGGLSTVIDRFGTDKLIVPKLPDDMVPSTKAYESLLKSAKNCGIKLTAAKAGTAYDLGRSGGITATLTILGPLSKSKFDDLNDYSVTARLDYGDVSWLFTGDLSEPGEQALLKSGADLDVTALKVGHHGSRYSSSDPFLEAVSPKICLISCGKDNSYGHPHDQAMKRLRAYTDNIYRTDELGTVSVYSDGDKLYVVKGDDTDDNS